jgi:CPA2 family monovalent cation:H+ antiporter-2
VIHHGLLQELVLLYAVAVVLLLVTSRLRVPSIVALIAAGVIAGPAGAGLVRTQENVDLMAEIGVALLLFTAGLEFSMTEMRRVWRRIVPGGLAQVGLTTAAVAGLIGLGFGGSLAQAGVVGLFVTLSSTAVVFKELATRNHMHAPWGRLTAGVLLLQDLVVIAVLALMPMMLGTSQSQGYGRAFFNLALAAAGMMLIGRVLLPRLLHYASSISREAFSLAVLLASVGTAWLAALVGLSMAAGAFVAGLVLAESEFSHQVHADVRPLRDLLSSLFFVSVGMLVDLREWLPVLPGIIGLAVGIVLLKATATTVALVIAKAPLRVAVAAALALAQIGEFSFVLGRGALDAGVISEGWWQILLGASVLTMAATPFLIGAAPQFAARFARGGDPHAEEDLERLALSDHVVILGYGVGGQLLARSLTELRVPYVALELNGATVREARQKGVDIHYADATAREPLEAAGVARAAVLVAVLSDPDASTRAIRTAREIAPNIPIIARTRYRLEADRMMSAGATLAVAEELEASLEVMSQLLARLEIPGNVAEMLVDGYRRTISAAVRQRPMRAPALPLDELPDDVRGAPVSSLQLPPEGWGVGKTLQEIDLRAATGATVLAVRRDQRTTTSPPSNFALSGGDHIYLLGEEADVMLARALLIDGPRASATAREP